MINVMIVDDQRLIREGLKTILEREQDIRVLGIAENGKEALDKIAVAKPDVVLMDIRMPVMDGVECTKNIKEKYPKVKVLMLTTFDEDKYIIDALRFGAEGYLLKDLALEKLVVSIKDIYKGNAIMQPEIAAKIVSHLTSNREQQLNSYSYNTAEANNNLKELTQRETEILRLVGRGLTNKDIAKTLCISEGTVKNYISTIYDKIGITERTKLIVYARENKLI